MNLRYRDRGTAVHKLNPVCKLAWVASVFVLALILNNPLYLTALFLSSLPLAGVARIWREWATVMKYAFYLCLAIIAINAIISQHGSSVLVQAPFRLPILGAPVITLEAIVFGAGMSLRLLAIISAFALLTFTIHPDDIMLAMLKLKLPYKSVMVTSLSTRFVPALINDAERISDVQRSRGLELDRGGLKHRISGRMAVIIPLLSNSLDRAVQVAEAMESRAFGSGEGRTFYKEIRFSKLDILGVALAVLPLVPGIYVRLTGHGDYRYYPTLERISLDGPGLYLLSALFLSLVLLVFLALVKKRVEFD